MHEDIFNKCHLNYYNKKQLKRVTGLNNVLNDIVKGIIAKIFQVNFRKAF